MKCKVCGTESGKYPLCKVCNIKKEKGEIIKCSTCGNWHPYNVSCALTAQRKPINATTYLYDTKKYLISQSERNYYNVILNSIPTGYCAFPQVNLASFIVKNDDSPYHNELSRNVDFLVTNEAYQPQFIIEINDQTHLNLDRKERDEKVQKICEEAGIPIVKFWTSYGVSNDYISKRINETIASLPVARVHHFDQEKKTTAATASKATVNRSTTKSSTLSYGNSGRRSRKQGCYVASCVYGSYDCPEVWVLRRFRDQKLSSTWHGKLFIKIYYFVSPIAVKLFGRFKWFHKFFKTRLDKFVLKLSKEGFDNTPYTDISN
jgi:hypothetical protein